MAGLLAGDYQTLKKRGITEETCRKFGYRVSEFKGEKVQVADYWNPEGTQVVAQKARTAGKEFFALGELKEAGLFGQQLWRDNGKMIVVTEGEIDAMTVSQLQQNKWPVVSVPTGAAGAGKAIKRSLEYLMGFDSVIFMFDQDDPGRAAMAECAALFPPGKCKIARLPLKDANDMLKAGKGGQVIDAIWSAKTYRPDGIVTLADIKAEVMAPAEHGLPWAFETLTTLTYGRRMGEVYAFGAGTGIGKTDFLTQQIAFDATELKEKVGLFFLEQQPAETGKRVAGKVAGKLFHVPDSGWTQEELEATWDQLMGSGNVFLYDHFGTTDWDIISGRIRYLAVSEGVRLFYLDHLTALAASQEDERKALEVIMGEIGSLVKELKIVIHLVSHLATPEGKPHEEGGRVMIRHFKGSRAIGFWCHFMFGLERAQQSDNEAEKRTTTFRVLKDRYTGRATGQVFYLGYDQDTGRLFETSEPSFKDNETAADEDLPF